MTDDVLTHATFVALVGESFAVRAPDGRKTAFRLDEAEDRSERMALPEGYRAPFSLLFRAQEDVDWPQGTFEYTHEAIGTIALFTSAIIDPKGHGRHAYEVVVA